VYPLRLEGKAAEGRRQVIISVASGKGGTGKTTIAVNLAVVAAAAGKPVRLVDCDVEEPNCHIFLKPRLSRTETVTVPVPVVDAAKCTGCGKCGEVCRFSAIVCIKKKVLTFPELCHACGGCILACPEGALSEGKRELGVLEIGEAKGVQFGGGRLRVGEAISPPLISAVKSGIAADGLTIIDAPPGTSCPVIEAVRGSGFVVLVTEPTPFGLNDLKLAVELMRVMKLPHGVVINRADIGDERVRDYCAAEGVAVLAAIPDDRAIAEAYSRGDLIVEAIPRYKAEFESLLAKLERGAA